MLKKLSKKDYRCYAHANAFKDTFDGTPTSPEAVDWKKHFENGTAPSFIDIGCGYGKFLVDTASLYPNENVLGLEIRQKVFEYVQNLTKERDNCSVIATNGLLFLVNYFKKDSLKKIFVLFPDPHFKKRKQKGRMICKQTMSIFKYLMAEDAKLYISTDVESLFKDMCEVIEDSGCFEMDTNTDDPLYTMCHKGTDEASRAGVKTGATFGKVYRVVK